MYAIMLHSVGNEKSQWHRWWISAALEHFDTLCQYLASNKYSTHFFDEWYEYFSHHEQKDPKKIVLSFDDGYLDNWVYVFPILKKYGLKGTAFVNPEFIETQGLVRPTIEEVWTGSLKQDELRTLGFLNWNEVVAMQKSGVIDIQSHSMSHNRYFRSSKIMDVYTGSPEHDWLSWFINPKEKPYSIMGEPPVNIPSGYPVFESDRALKVRRYFPDDRLIERAVNIYNKNSEVNSELIQKVQQLIIQYPGRYETDGEMEQRYRYELFCSKAILEKKLNKKVDFLCWPGGGYNSLSLKLSMEAGYKASTVSSVDFNTYNLRAGNYYRISRFGLSSVISHKRGHILINDPSFLVSTLRSKTGNYPLRIWMKLEKEFRKILAK